MDKDTKDAIFGFVLIAVILFLGVATLYGSCSANKDTQEWEDAAKKWREAYETCDSVITLQADNMARALTLLETQAGVKPAPKTFVVESRTFEQYQGTIGESLPDPPE